MANWSGTSRSNYVRISDEEGLTAAVEKFGLKTSKDQEGLTAFFPGDSGDGDWPSWVTSYEDDPEDPDNKLEIEEGFTFATAIMPFVAEGQVLIVMSAGAEKLSYITGHAEAFIRKGEDVHWTAVNLENIYKKAAEAFGVEDSEITEAAY